MAIPDIVTNIPGQAWELVRDCAIQLGEAIMAILKLGWALW